MAFGFFKSLIQKFSGKPVDWDELEESLIRADLGVPMTVKILSALKPRADEVTAKDIIEVTRAEIARVLPLDNPVLRPFEQVETSYSRRQGGSGLGLPYAKRLTELHGGELKIESELGKGTIASVTLPPSRLVEIRKRAEMKKAM